MAKLRLEQGRTEEARNLLAGQRDFGPGRNHVWEAMRAAAHAEEEDGRAAAWGLVSAGFQNMPGQMWPLVLAYLTEVAAGARDADLAARLQDLLTPWGGLAIGRNFATHVPGAVDRYLGQLAATRGLFDEADARYQAALALEESLHAPPLIARTRYWYGRMLLERGSPADSARAADLLAAALETADRLGMADLAQRASALLDGPPGGQPAVNAKSTVPP